MRFHPLFVHSFLFTRLRALATPFPPLSGSVNVKEVLDAALVRWGSLEPPAEITIEFHFVLNPQCESDLVEALVEVGGLTHTKDIVHYSASGFTYMYRYAADTGPPTQGADR